MQEIEVRLRADEPGRRSVLVELDRGEALWKDDFYHLFDLLAAGGLDDDAERVTLDQRYEASWRRVPDSRWFASFVYDPSSRLIVVLALTRQRPERSRLFAEACKALDLVNPVREDH